MNGYSTQYQKMFPNWPCVILLFIFINILQSQTPADHILSATAITEVFGDGLRLTGVALEYKQDIFGSNLARQTFSVSNRTLTNVYTATCPSPTCSSVTGRYVVLDLDPEDEDGRLIPVPGEHGHGPGPGGDPGQSGNGPGPGPGGNPGKGGPPPGMVFIHNDAVTTATWSGPITTVTGDKLDPGTPQNFNTSGVHNVIVDEFVQRSYTDPQTGLILKYNLFIPREYNPERRYPLVLFVHDAGVTSNDSQSTLLQGLGAVVWARPSEQAKRPAFILAPQYSIVVTNDQSETSPYLDVTLRLIQKISNELSIDPGRLYTTGQSMGGMLSIAINIKYPDLFAASLLVACQWDANLVAPMAKAKLLIIVSEGDLKAYPGQNVITQRLEELGTVVNRAVWNGRWSAGQFDRAYRVMAAEGAPVNYVALKNGTVVSPGQEDNGGNNHRNTWRITYDIEGLREWIFAQRRF